MSEERKAFWAKCGTCSHCWPICYLPMEVMKAAALMKSAACPSCGERKRITVAKQKDGRLQEEATAS